MEKIKEFYSKTFSNKDPYLVGICTGGLEYMDLGISFTDYDKVADYIITAFCNEGIYDLHSYADFRFYILMALEHHGINGPNYKHDHFSRAIQIAADRNESLGRFEKQYAAHPDQHLLGHDKDLKPHMEVGSNLFLFILCYLITGAIIFIPAWFLMAWISERMGIGLSESSVTNSIMIIYAIPWIIFYICYEIEDYKDVKYWRSTTKKQLEIEKKRNVRIKKRAEFWCGTLDFIKASFWALIMIAMIGFGVYQIARIVQFIWVSII